MTNSCKNVDSSINVKNLANHSSILIKHWVSFVLIYYNKCKIPIMNNDFNILEMNGST